MKGEHRMLARMLTSQTEVVKVMFGGGGSQEDPTLLVTNPR